MAIVYRSVPSFISTVKEQKEVNEKQANLEGDLYDLGYISFEKGYSFFRTSGDESLNTFNKDINEYTKFFFLFPTDVIRCTHSGIEGLVYSEENWRILEYNIPDYILLNYCGYGFYDGEAIVEFRIPENVFSNFDLGTVDIDKLRNDLYNKYIKENGSEFIDEYNKAIAVKRNIHFSQFVTGNSAIISEKELYKYDENGDIIDVLQEQDIINLLKQKGINCNERYLEIYSRFKREDWDVCIDKDESVRDLKDKLKVVLPEFKNSMKLKINKIRMDDEEER